MNKTKMEAMISHNCATGCVGKSERAAKLTTGNNNNKRISPIEDNGFFLDVGSLVFILLVYRKLSFVWYRGWDSNPHGVATTGF